MSRGFFSLKFLRLSLGVFFIILGAYGISGIEEGFFSLNNSNHDLEIIFGVVEIVCGILLFAGVFLFGNTRAVYIGGLIVLVFWVARLVLSKIIWGISFGNNITFSGGLYTWLLAVATELVITAGIMGVLKSHN